MSGWSDPQKGGRAVGAALYPTLSSLLSTAPQPGMRATASDAPGSMLYEVGGKWGGDLGSVSQATMDALTAGELALLADGVTAVVCGYTRQIAGGAWLAPQRYRALSGVASYLYFPGAGPLSGNVTGKTLAAKFPCPRRFLGFRINIPSGDSAVMTYSYAFSSSPSDNGMGLTWTTITFSGNSTITRAASGTVPSDVMPVIKNSQTDLYLYVRAYSESATVKFFDAGGGQYFASAELAAFGDYASQAGRTSGDLTASGFLACGSGDWAAWQVTGADFYGPDCFTVGAIGDSLDQGWSVNGGSSSETNWRLTAKFAAKNLQASGYCAGYYSLAKAGEKHTVSVAKVPSQFFGNDVFSDFITLRTWSPNDGATASTFAKGRAETAAAIARIMGNGGTPVVATPTPCGASGEKETYRLLSVAYAKDPSHGGVPVDIATPVADPNNIANIKSDYLDTSGNSTHFNTAGYELIGNTYGARIAAVLVMRGVGA